MRIPVIVLSGFLGSGKTTLLLRLLEESKRRGLQHGILMNELGKQDVDGLIVDEHSGAVLEKLLDGCVCYSKKSELGGSLKMLLNRKPDVIFIELTGVANPEEIADALTEPRLIGHLRLKQIITLLDAEHVLDYNSIFASDKQLVQTLRRQIEVADMIVVNKTDLVRMGHILKIKAMIHKHNDRAIVSFTKHSYLDLSPVLDGVEQIEITKQATFKRLQMAKVSTGGRSEEKQKDSHHHHENERSFSRVQTFTLPCSSTHITKKQVEQFLSLWGNSLLRAKGYILISEAGKMLLMQHAGRRTYWEPTFYSGEPYIVLIGIEMNEESLQSAWNSSMK
ncbi:CobW family GTP-binding protein [Paenibacillus whitsoniae]|uniref:GTP-binding protein n=1 Tax=Paenibacillus whitsoniae TaxID=2496558 RepID=A0A430JJ46_9BACL|nr:GTP-binding protein [Paenibacillus whitsoniae]RTE11029.1 GTP-binding protein [Paenibacillus whitsoniae]